MASAVENDLTTSLINISIKDQVEIKDACEKEGIGSDGVCAICLNFIELKETALIKGCEHAYCVTCILHWATYSKNPTCPQCKMPFDFLNIHRSLDGTIHDYMFEESVCLLLRASWFKPLSVEERAYSFDDVDNLNLEAFEYDIYYEYEDEDEDDDLDDVYASSSARLRLGNRRWGDNGYVRAGRQEARPVAGASSSRDRKEPVKDRTGRRAKRTLKREAADRAAAEKHEKHLLRLGRK